jgi:hypothetical protein
MQQPYSDDQIIDVPALPIANDAPAGQLAPIDPQLKEMGQRCFELMPPEQQTPEYAQRIAALIMQGDYTSLSNFYQALVEVHETNLTYYAPHHEIHYSPTDLDYYQTSLTYQGGDTYSPTIVYEVYAPQITETHITEVYSPHEIYAPYYAPHYEHHEGGDCSCGVDVNIHNSNSSSGSAGSSQGGDLWNGLLLFLTLVLGIVLATGIWNAIASPPPSPPSQNWIIR